MSSSLAAAGVSLAASNSQAQAPATKAREYYALRKYQLQSGSQSTITQSYVGDALIPALNRLGLSPIGAFNLYMGSETPALYLLMPSVSLDTLVNAELRLANDEEFMKAATPFWSAPASAPAFTRIESSLLAAFEGWPRLVVPPVTADHGSESFSFESTKAQASRTTCVRWRCSIAGNLRSLRDRAFGRSSMATH